jgi:hypothetical protein
MAKNDEVAHSFQPLMGAHGGQVADPVIEADIGWDLSYLLDETRIGDLDYTNITALTGGFKL